MRAQVVRGLKWLGIVVAVLFVVLVATAAGLWWWSGTQGSLDWALRQAAKSQTLDAQGVKGSLREGFTAKQLRWEKDGLEIEASDAQLAWQPLALVRATLKFDHLRASRMVFEDKRPPQPKKVPVSLVLPMRVEVDELKIAQVQWRAGDNVYEAQGIAGSYSFNTVHHKVQLDSLTWAGGTYAGEATVGAHGSLPVQAKLRGRFEAPVPGSTAKVPLAFETALEGPITALEARAQLQGRPNTPSANTRATASARVTPWEPQPVAQAQAQFQALDLAVLWPQAPRTQLSGNASVQPSGTTTWVIDAKVANADAGPWDARKLPLEQATAKAEVRTDGQALVRSIEARLGGGELRAKGEWRGTDGWTVDGELTRVDPAALHTQMASVPIGGRVKAQGRGEAIDFDADLQAQGKSRGLGGLEVRSLAAKGRWADGLLSLPALDARLADATLKAAVDVRPQSWSGSGRAQLEAPGLQARVEGLSLIHI